jgi:hypothetical protein
MLNVINQSDIVLNVIMLSVIMLSSVLAPHRNKNATVSIMMLATEGWYAECH